MDEKRENEPGPAGGAPTGVPPAAPDQRPRPVPDTGPAPSALAGLGLQFVVVVLLGLFGGRWLDAKLGTTPLLMVLGVLLGAGASTWSMYRKVFPVDR